MLRIALLLIALLSYSQSWGAPQSIDKPTVPNGSGPCKTDCKNNGGPVVLFSSEQNQQQAPQSKEQSHWYEGATLILNVFLVIANILLWCTSNRMARDTRLSSSRQSLQTRKSISHAGRSADAMSGVATTMQANLGLTDTIIKQQKHYAQKQMRAYLSVVIGLATYPVGTRKHFSVGPKFINSGHTPAKDVRYRMTASIENVKLDDTGFPFTKPDEWKGTSIIGPSIDILLWANTKEIADTDLITSVMLGENGTGDKRLFIWGEVEYKDVFEETHITGFCQYVWWIVNDDGKWGLVVGNYTKDHQYIS